MPAVRPGRYVGTFAEGSRILTINRDPGRRVYGEDLVLDGGREYRVWNPSRSKLSAALHNGLGHFPFKETSRVLYLGAASGTTASHVSDVCSNGSVVCVEVAPRPFRDLIGVCERRKNMVPIMADASRPESYAPLAQSVDVVYQDIAQKDQPGILARNIEAIPPSSGTAILMVKARSIDVTANPAKVFARVERELEGLGYTVAERVPLEPYERDHEAMVVKAGGALERY